MICIQLTYPHERLKPQLKLCEGETFKYFKTTISKSEKGNCNLILVNIHSYNGITQLSKEMYILFFSSSGKANCSMESHITIPIASIATLVLITDEMPIIFVSTPSYSTTLG